MGAGVLVRPFPRMSFNHTMINPAAGIWTMIPLVADDTVSTLLFN
jgi:hypothetical protein